MSKRKICVVTGTRAEYGLLYWLMKEIELDDQLQLQLIVTGMHLSPEFGLTYQTIEQDGFSIDAKVEMLLSSDTPVGIAKSIGLGVIGFAEALDRLKPDIMVVLGDRYEILAAAEAAMVARIPIAHISGGEKTEGAIDEAIRHAITKMAQLHFVGAEEYQNRVIQMGEDPNRVFQFGDIGIDNINRLTLLSKRELEESLGFSLGMINFLVTYHPVTLLEQSSEKSLRNLLKALFFFKESKIIFTKPNSDSGSRKIITLIDEYAMQYPKKVYASTSLGQIRYLSAMRYCDVIIGNSSSGIVEAPAMKKATINIGIRQQGRLRATSIIDCDDSVDGIKNAVTKALSKEFQVNLQTTISLYGNGDTARRIKEKLKVCELSVIKIFHDI